MVLFLLLRNLEFVRYSKDKGIKSSESVRFMLFPWDDIVMIKDFKLGKTKMTLKRGKSLEI